MPSPIVAVAVAKATASAAFAEVLKITADIYMSCITVSICFEVYTALYLYSSIFAFMDLTKHKSKKSKDMGGMCVRVARET